jgi:hypothetical protein
VIRSSEGRRGSGPALDPRAVRRRDTVRARSGAVAGILSTVGFTAIHDLFISDIWNMLPIMAVAGALCGVCIAWSYGLVCEQPSITGWLRYNLVYVTMLGLLGATSVAIAANEPPTELISTAMPMTIAFALLAAATLSGLYGRRWSHHATILVTVVVVVLFLGLNVSAIGLVDIPTDATSLVAEMLGLILTLALLYAALFIALERQVLRRPDRARDRNATR